MKYFQKFESFNQDITEGDLVHFQNESPENGLYEVLEVSIDVEYLMKKYNDHYWDLNHFEENIVKTEKRIMFMRENYKGEWAALKKIDGKRIYIGDSGDLVKDISIEPLYANYPNETNYVPYVIYMKKMDKNKRTNLKDYGILDM